MTVKELIDRLMIYPMDFKVEFQEQQFYRVKRRGPKLVQIEFAEPANNTQQTPVSPAKE